MAAQPTTEARCQLTITLTERQKKILEALSIVWRKSMQEIVMTCLRPVLDQHEDALERLEEVRAEMNDDESVAGSS